MLGKKILVPWFSLVLYAGCAPTTTVYTIPTAFDASEAEKLLVDGTNRIEGRAQINFNEGGMATCAGGQVVLIPATQYAKERMHRVFNGKEVLFHPRVGAKNDIRFEPDDPAYARLMKVVTCDKEGNFEFTALADGEFIVGATINWGGGNSAAFIRQVSLANGVKVNVEFSHQMYRDMYQPRHLYQPLDTRKRTN